MWLPFMTLLSTRTNLLSISLWNHRNLCFSILFSICIYCFAILSATSNILLDRMKFCGKRFLNQSKLHSIVCNIYRFINGKALKTITLNHSRFHSHSKLEIFLIFLQKKKKKKSWTFQLHGKANTFDVQVVHAFFVFAHRFTFFVGVEGTKNIATKIW